jgi:ATP-binding cassette, subfamily B, bacterial
VKIGLLNNETIEVYGYIFKPFKNRFIFVTLLFFLSGLFETVNYAVLYPVINYGLEQSTDGFLLRIFNLAAQAIGMTDLFLFSCFLLIFVSFVSTFVKALSYFFSNKLSLDIIGSLQKRVLKNYIDADFEFYVNNKQGKLIHNSTIAADKTANLIMTSIRVLNDIFGLLMLTGFLFALTWKGTLLIIISGVIYFSLVKSIANKIMYRCGKLQLEADREKNVILNELITGIKTVKVYQSFFVWRQRFVNAVETSITNLFKVLMGRVVPELFIRLIFFVLIAISGIFIYINTNGNILPVIPLFGTFGLVASRVLPVVQSLGGNIMALAESLPSAKIIYQLLNEETNKVVESSVVLETFNEEIEFSNIWFKFNAKDDFLFKGLCFTVQKKKVTAVVGPSGFGKTTLINLLLRLYSPSKGTIKIDGVDISAYSIQSTLKHFGYVSQETFIFNSTVKNNIRFGMKNCTDEMIEEAAKLANADEFILKMTDGYDSMVGDAGIKLSGGQRQRIAIARAILRKPEIIVLDEATSSLDNISEKKVQEAINKISKNTTVLVVAHRLSTIKNADKILLLSGGKIQEEGSHEDLMKKKGEYYMLQTTKN